MGGGYGERRWQTGGAEDECVEAEQAVGDEQGRGAGAIKGGAEEGEEKGKTAEQSWLDLSMHIHGPGEPADKTKDLPRRRGGSFNAPSKPATQSLALHTGVACRYRQEKTREAGAGQRHAAQRAARARRVLQFVVGQQSRH